MLIKCKNNLMYLSQSKYFTSRKIRIIINAIHLSILSHLYLVRFFDINQWNPQLEFIFPLCMYLPSLWYHPLFPFSIVWSNKTVAFFTASFVFLQPIISSISWHHTDGSPQVKTLYHTHTYICVQIWNIIYLCHWMCHLSQIITILKG